MKDATGKKAKVEFNIDAIVNNTTKKKELEGYISEIVMYKARVKKANGDIGDIYKTAKDALGIPRKILAKLVKEDMNPGSIEAEAADIEEVKAVSEMIDVPKAQFE